MDKQQLIALINAKIAGQGTNVDAWFDFDGILTADQFTGTLTNRYSLLLAETVKYKRFLGFLWKTRRIQDRQLDVVSKNPHTEIMGIEHIVLEK